MQGKHLLIISKVNGFQQSYISLITMLSMENTEVFTEERA